MTALAVYEVEQDFSQALKRVGSGRADEVRDGGRGSVRIATASGEVDEILGSRYLTDPVGFRISDGLVEVIVSGRTNVLRTYGAWTWVEGDNYVPPSPQVFV